MTLAEIVKAHWTNTVARRAAADMAMDWLGTKPDTARFGTSELIRALGGKGEDIKPFASHLTNARADGIMEGYFTTGPKGSFGRPRIIWHNDAGRLV